MNCYVVGRNEVGTSAVLRTIPIADADPSALAVHDLWLPGAFSPERDGCSFRLAQLPAGADYGFHETPTVDLGVIVAGSIRMGTESGEAVDLGPGDQYVIEHAAHTWSVGPTGVTMAVAHIGVGDQREKD